MLLITSCFYVVHPIPPDRLDEVDISCYIEHKFNIEGDEMVQVLKEDVKRRIYDAAVAEFFEKDYQTATIRSIAKRAAVPLGLVYSYFKNKADLFEAVVEPVMTAIDNIMQLEESKTEKNPEDLFEHLKKQTNSIIRLIDSYKTLIILIDKSQGTHYQHFKDELIQRVELHIQTEFIKRAINQYDDLLFHIWASSFIEGVCEIIRHYKNQKWAEQMIELLVKHYCFGISAFWQ
jgi:AcrR family transcriptional regulator